VPFKGGGGIEQFGPRGEGLGEGARHNTGGSSRSTGAWEWQLRCAARAHARSDRGGRGLAGGPLYSPRRRGPLPCWPQTQSRGLNSPNRSNDSKFKI
jgi:hypothetical protein